MYNVPYGDTQQLNLDWFIKRWKEFYAEWKAAEAGIDGALDAEIEKVENAMQDLYAARDAAAASATAAAGSATSASTSATTATNAATAAANSATLANSKAAAAGLSEANAAQSANSASNSASAAATSASQANASAASATASEQAAAGSASAAAGSASAAATSETNAATSETNAAASAQEAEDVLESIPEDYSTLSADVVELKTSTAPLVTTAFKNTFIESNTYSAYSSRQVKVQKNKITVTRNGSGTGYAIYALTNTAKTITNVQTVTTANVQTLFNDGCFIDFPPIRKPFIENGLLDLILEIKRSGINCSTVRTYMAIAEPNSEEESGYSITWNNIDYSNNLFAVGNQDIIYVTMPSSFQEKLTIAGIKICLFIHVQSGYADARGSATIEINLLPSLIPARTIKAITPYYIRWGSTATTAIPQNSLVFWIDTLYKAATNIASGETLTVGTNITATSINDELLAL